MQDQAKISDFELAGYSRGNARSFPNEHDPFRAPEALANVFPQFQEDYYSFALVVWCVLHAVTNVDPDDLRRTIHQHQCRNCNAKLREYISNAISLDPLQRANIKTGLDLLQQQLHLEIEHPEARNWWATNMRNNSVELNAFLAYFTKRGIVVDTMRSKMRQMWPSETLSANEFYRLVQCFPGFGSAAWWGSVCDTLSQPWFVVCTEDTVLAPCEEGTFFVRLSREPSSFSLVLRAATEIKAKRLNLTEMQRSLIQIVNEYIEQRQIITCYRPPLMSYIRTYT